MKKEMEEAFKGTISRFKKSDLELKLIGVEDFSGLASQSAGAPSELEYLYYAVPCEMEGLWILYQEKRMVIDCRENIREILEVEFPFCNSKGSTLQLRHQKPDGPVWLTIEAEDFQGGHVSLYIHERMLRVTLEQGITLPEWTSPLEFVAEVKLDFIKRLKACSPDR